MWPNPEETADLVTCTEEIVNGKLHFWFSDTRTARAVSLLRRIPAVVNLNNGNIPCVESTIYLARSSGICWKN